MKKLILLSIMIALIFSFAACELEETYSAKERMEAFIADVNKENWSDLKAHTHPDATMYAEADDDFWSNEFGSHRPLGNLSVSGTTATFTDAEETITYTAMLKEDGADDYKIYQIHRYDTLIYSDIRE